MSKLHENYAFERLTYVSVQSTIDIKTILSFRSGLYLLSLTVLHTWLTTAVFSLSFSVPLLPSAAWFPMWFMVRILTAARLTLHLNTNAMRMTTLY